jgi:glucose/arabinose dehydrogenase
MKLALVTVLVLALAACASAADEVDTNTGPHPVLPAPAHGLLPTIHIADAIGWQPGTMPQAAPGLRVELFASELSHPRWLTVLPTGEVLVAESAAPTRPQDAKGIKGWFMKRLMRKAGSVLPSADRITLLRDADGDGVAESRRAFLENLHSPIGMALVGDKFFVANTDAVWSYDYAVDGSGNPVNGRRLVELPAGEINHHWTKNLVASLDGTRLYVSVGSNSNIAENGFDAETDRAAIHEILIATGAHRVFASGLRNPNGMGWEPESGRLWTVVNERDELGDNLVPDYLTSITDGAFYGWPYSYYGQNIDARVKPQKPALVASAIPPDYSLGSHVAPLGLAFGRAGALPPDFQHGAFVGEHGSWNRKPRSGYKVVFVPFKAGRPNGPPVDVLTGFLSSDGKAYGRPVGVAIDNAGALLIADDVGNVIWRVTATQ